MTSKVPESAHTSVVFIDGSFNTRGSRAKLILENEASLTFEVSMRFEFLLPIIKPSMKNLSPILH